MSAAATKPTALVKLHRALYMQQAIKDAANDFADFATFSVSREGDYYAVKISEIDTDVDGDVVAEFSNFALANTASRKKKKAG